MVIYIVISFVFILIGMAISVYAFGTGEKRKKIFNNIYFSVENHDNIGIVYTKTGECSAILKLDNPVLKYSADIDSYYDFTNIYESLLMTIGEGYALHKQDIFNRRKFENDSNEKHEFLSESYFKYYNGRFYTSCETYLTITQENKKSNLFSYDKKKWSDFLVKIRKVQDQLRNFGISSEFLEAKKVKELADRYFSQNFGRSTYSMNNFSVDEEKIMHGDHQTKIYSVVDVDCITLPSSMRPFNNIEVNNTSMPVDLLSFLDSIPEAETVVYNQMLFVPNQRKEMSKLDKKKNQCSSLPNPSNLLVVEDINNVQAVLARENKQLVYSHFNITVTTPAEVDMQKCTNHLENMFSRLGIHISKRAYNQLELFVNSFPGNCYSTNEEYDRFLTISEAAICLMYKEKNVHNESTPFKVYYTDRQGVPVCIDISGKEGKEKLTDNSNFFVLGPSGSGKSFYVNSMVRQAHEQNTDIVLVDTGNSYEGLCEYFNGKYISYTEEKPITMNPFQIKKEEWNIEKLGFLKNLVMLIWKGSNGEPTKTESRLIEEVINEYYDVFFNGFDGFTPNQREDLMRSLTIDDRNNPKYMQSTEEERKERVNLLLDEIEAKRKQLKVTELTFNSFYEYSVQRIPAICQENQITGIDISTYRYMMKDFYRGGTHEKTLNEKMDTSLFDETFIVFEIDSIKDDPLLFPLVTLIIMDVFLQKMRIKKNRKMLIIEEAWKAIASPMMAEYIKYLYKTARKFWASVGVVTQEIQDIIGSKIVKEAIINNSDVIMLLDQSKFKERFTEIKSILGLTDVDCKKIFTINRLENKDGRAFFREVFIRRGSTSAVYGVEEPRECYMTYTTERAEKEALKLYKAELRCNHQEAIEAYCGDWNASGISKSLAFAQKVNAAGKVLNLKK